MTDPSRRVAGVLLIIMPTVVLGGASLLILLVGNVDYSANPMRQDLWRAGHAHAGVLLILTLVALRYVDEAALAERTRWFVRLAFPSAALLLPTAFFLAVLGPDATEPNSLIHLAYLGAVVLVAAMATLGVGLIRGRAIAPDQLHRSGSSPRARSTPRRARRVSPASAVRSSIRRRPP